MKTFMTAADAVVSLMVILIDVFVVRLTKSFVVTFAKFLSVAIKTNYVRHLSLDSANNTYKKNNNNDDKGEGTTTKSNQRESGV